MKGTGDANGLTNQQTDALTGGRRGTVEACSTHVVADLLEVNRGITEAKHVALIRQWISLELS